MITKVLLRNLIKNIYDFKCKPFSTIYSLSSGHGKCGVAVIRISGPESKMVLTEMAGFYKLPPPRNAKLRKIKVPHTNETIDVGLVLWFPGPNSFTGEDCCELHTHGSKAVIKGILEALSSFENYRHALPGEFVKRAFYNGKLDLTEVEGLSNLINAETVFQRQMAVQQMGGHLSKLYASWRDILKKCVARVEAAIDFGEEENLEELLPDTLKILADLKINIQKYLEDGRRGERLKDGVNAVILGAPNAGKSSFLNLLCMRDAAIVSSEEGTTRDVLSVTLDIYGYPLVINDTAGLRIATNCGKIEIEGMRRARLMAKESHLIFVLIEVSYITSHELFKKWKLEKNETFRSIIYKILCDYIDQLGLGDVVHNCVNSPLMTNEKKENNAGFPKCIFVINKIDLAQDLFSLIREVNNVFGLSCTTQFGFEGVMQSTASLLKELCEGDVGVENCCINLPRQRECLKAIVECLENCGLTSEPDLVAHYLRQALYQISVITGHISTEQILDIIFKQFCIGK